MSNQEPQGDLPPGAPISPVDLRDYLEPPGSLSDEWNGVHQALVGPVRVVFGFYSTNDSHLLPLDALAPWYKGLRLTTSTARQVLTYLHGRAQKTWNSGRAIDRAIFPIYGFLSSVVSFLTDPLWVPFGPEKQTGPSRTRLAELRAFDWRPLLVELAAAVVSESNVKIELAHAFKKNTRDGK